VGGGGVWGGGKGGGGVTKNKVHPILREGWKRLLTPNSICLDMPGKGRPTRSVGDTHS